MALEINIKIESPQLTTAILALVDVYGEMVKRIAVTPAELSTVVSAAPATAQAAVGAASETTAAGPAQSAKSATSDTPAVSLEEVRAQLARLSQAGHQAKVKELIKSTGASKLTEVPPEKYAELLAEAKKLS